MMLKSTFVFAALPKEIMQTLFLTRFTSAAFAAFLVASAPASAETITNGIDFKNSQHMIAHMRQYDAEILGSQGQLQDKKLNLQQGCATGYRVQVMDAGVIEPIEFAENAAHPTKGFWRIGYDMIRCGETKRYNTLFKAKESGEAPTTTQYYPGVTKANMELIRDTLKTLMAGVVAQTNAPKDCKSFAMADMKVLSQSDSQGGGTWEEAWTVNLCNVSAMATVTFLPDANGKGTSFKISFPKNVAASGRQTPSEQETNQLSEDNTKTCQLSSHVILTLAKYRDMGGSRSDVSTKAYDELSREISNRRDILKDEISKRIEFVYSIPQWSKESFSHFDWSVCKMNYLSNRKLKFPEMNKIVIEVNACEASYQGEKDFGSWRRCVEEVTLRHSQY